jgi:hypothetical protein
MTDCTTRPLVFASIDRRQIVADFKGGDLTSDGGLPLLREVDRRIGLLDALDDAIGDPVHGHQEGYAAESWDRPRRVIAKAEYGDKGDNPRFLVTSLSGNAQELYEKVYCQRGEAENRIKEQQLHLFADRTSCHDFLANQFRVLLSAAAYVLMETLRRVGLAGTELAQAQVDTIRLKVLKIGARVVRSVRRIVLHLASGYPLQELLAGALRRLQDWRCMPAGP